jgi:hypothetical protein
MSTKVGRKSKPPTQTIDDKTHELWKVLSQQVHTARCAPQPQGVNELLRPHIDEQGPLAPMLMHWAGDNLAAGLQFEQARDAYAALLDRHVDLTFAGIPWGVHALEQAAVCYTRLGDFERASDAHEQRLKTWPSYVSATQTYFRQAELAERAGDDRAAIALYRRAAESKNWPRQGLVNLRDLARRNAERLELGAPWVRADVNQLANELGQALRHRDDHALDALASATHFSYAPGGGERGFVDRGAALGVLRSELATAELGLDPSRLRGSGGKLYLDTVGWRGEVFGDDVSFLLSRTSRGYEWSGVIGRPRKHLNGNFPRDPKEVPDTKPPKRMPKPGPTTADKTPADLRLKAPFARGEFFRVGGIAPMAAELAALAASVAGTGPLFPLFYGGALIARAAASPCGLGIGGLYYGQPTTHVDRYNYAVDFATYLRGIPFALATRGRPVLAIADGIVTYVQSSIASGDPTEANSVSIDHLLDVEAAVQFFVRLFGGAWQPTRFGAEYLHFDGPGLMPVSVGMFVRQGARLGVMDDTGLSVLDHLHFSLHDRTLPWISSSVRPTPMDGQTLNDNDDGRCMFSTNVPIP